MMLKKVLSLTLSVIMALTVFCVTASAIGITPYDISSASKLSTLVISGTTATCKSIYDDTASVASISVVQTLEKHAFLWSWDTVGSEKTKTVYSTDYLSFTNTQSGLASGTYRVKSVFTVTLSSGTSQTTTVYSSEKTI